MAQLQVDKLGDSAYLPCLCDQPIYRSKELVVLGMNGIDIEETSNPSAISLRFGVRNFIEGVDQDVPTLILDQTIDNEVCGIEIPHYSHFSQWLVVQGTT